MNDFLKQIAGLDSVRNVMFLSRRGELLFSSLPDPASGQESEIGFWKEIIEDLDHPHEADVVFSNGRYYLRKTALGMLVVGMHDGRELSKIKFAGKQIFEKSSDPNLRKKILLKMLLSADDTVKPHLILELVAFADQDVGAALTALLKKEADFRPDVRKKLLLYICRALGHCPFPEAIQPLQQLLASAETASAGKRSLEIREAVGVAIEQLRSVPSRAASSPAAGEQKSPFSPLPAGTGGVSVQETKETARANGSIPRAGELNSLLESGKKNEAISLAMELIEQSAKQKQFAQAEELRDLLMHIDSMALKQIVRAAEIIEEEKQASISKEHLEVWKNLVELLTPDEFPALYHSLVLKKYGNGELIAEQGTSLATLFFINSGRVQIEALKTGVRFQLNTRVAGEIIGAETFFDASVWTVNATSLGAELFLLSREALDALQDAYPTLESKLARFCSSFQTSSAALKSTRKDRRQSERKKVTGRLSFTVLDESGNEMDNEAKGELIDISELGVAFSIHASRKRNAVGFFGRQLRVGLPAGTAAGVLTRDGVVRAVRDMDLISREYSVHIRFNEPLSRRELQQVLDAAEKGGKRPE